jgi:hypothetical protein
MSGCVGEHLPAFLQHRLTVLAKELDKRISLPDRHFQLAIADGLEDSGHHLDVLTDFRAADKNAHPAVVHVHCPDQLMPDLGANDGPRVLLALHNDAAFGPFHHDIDAAVTRTSAALEHAIPHAVEENAHEQLEGSPILHGLGSVDLGVQG